MKDKRLAQLQDRIDAAHEAHLEALQHLRANKKAPKLEWLQALERVTLAYNNVRRAEGALAQYKEARGVKAG